MAKTANLLIATVAGFALLGCRGEISTKPPIHLVPNMDFQDKVKAQSKVDFPGWKDNRGMRKPVEGTIARGNLKHLSEDEAERKLHTWYSGEGADKKFVTENPVPATLANLNRGKERYDIHCAVCHGLDGRGAGIVGRKFMQKPPSFVPKRKGEPKAPDGTPLTRHDPRVYTVPDGHIFDVITNGYSTMKPYATQVSVHDRWCIIHYIRALQDPSQELA